MFQNIEYHLLILRCLHLLGWVNCTSNCATAHCQLRFIAGSINVMIHKGVKSCHFILNKGFPNFVQRLAQSYFGDQAFSK